MLLFAILAALFTTGSAAGSKWSWSRSDNKLGVNAWSKLSPTCSAAQNARQSPVDLTNAVVNTHLSLTYSPSYSLAREVVLTNSHGKVHWSYKASDDLFVTDARGDEFVLDGVHFHWGGPDQGGSEHTVAGRRHTAEMHFVHYLRSDKNVQSAVAAGADHLLVIGVFIQVTNDLYFSETSFSLDMKMLLTNFGFIHDDDESKSVTVNAQALIPTRSEYFYHYPGGLTTPGCQGVVQWYVYKRPHVISYATISQYMWSASTAPLTSADTVHGPNWRPTQRIGFRTIHTNNPNTATRRATSVAATLLCGVLARMMF